jgi:hypothetical protein
MFGLMRAKPAAMKLTIAVMLLSSGLSLAQVTPAPLKPASMGASPTEKERPVQKPVAPPPASTGPTAAAQKLSFAQQAFGLAHSAYRQGNISADAAATWSRRIYEAQKDTDPQAAKQHLDRMIALEKLAKDRNQQGDAPMLDVMTIGYFRAEAEQFAGKK